MAQKRQKLVATVSAISLLAAPLATSPLSAQRVEVGNAAGVVGKVSLRVNGSGDSRKVARKQRFAWGDVIATGKKSQLQILLLDRSTFGMGARSQLRVDRYVYNPNEGRSLVASFIKGALRFFSGRQEGSNSAEVNTPAGRIGIRGTAVDMLVGKRAEKIAEDHDFVGKVDSNKDEATLVVLRGPGAATEGGLNPGLVEVEGADVIVTLNAPGLAAYIPRAGAAPIGPFRISDEGLADVQDELAPEVARAAKGGGLLKTLIPVALTAIALSRLLDKDDNTQQNPTGQGTNEVGDSPQAPTGQNPPQQTPNPQPGTSSVPTGQGSSQNPQDPNGGIG